MAFYRHCQSPVCVSPSYGSRSSMGFGSGSSGSGMMRYGGYGSGGGMSSGSLGIVPGVTPSCISQTPSSEVVIQPPPFVLTIPGPILSASCEPIAVAAHSPCASGYGMGSHGMGSLGMGSHQGMGSLGMGSHQGMGSLGMGSSQGYLGGGSSGMYGSKRRSSFSY